MLKKGSRGLTLLPHYHIAPITALLSYCPITFSLSHYPRTLTVIALIQSQKTQGFCVAHFATLSDERRSRSKIFLLFIWIKEPCVRKFEGPARSKLPGISQTVLLSQQFFTVPLSYCPSTFSLSYCPAVLLSHCPTVTAPFHCPTVLLTHYPSTFSLSHYPTVLLYQY